MGGVSTPIAPPDKQPDAPQQEARWIRPALAIVAAIGLLLLGAAGGLVVGMPSSNPAVPAPGSVDVGFAQDMTVHHQQAVTMAAWERDHTTDTVLHQLASDIEATQMSQIGRMQGWLELWGAASLPSGDHMAWMAGSSHEHAPAAPGGVATMPGMASDEELAAMRAATGRDLDVLFLQLMLRHHQGGAGMLEYGAQYAAVPQVRNLASQMLRSQSVETDYLRQLLVERGGQPLPL